MRKILRTFAFKPLFMILDILAFGIHPDDVELSAGGTLLKHKALGYKVGICDLTHGELGSRGSGELRLVEAANAAKILGIDARENIGLPDAWAIDNQESCLKIIQIIRKYRPRIILCNAKEDRHPDHAKGAEMVQKATFLSGLIKIKTESEGKPQEHFRPSVVYNYIQFQFQKPDLVVDISDHEEKKFEAIKAYSSQFYDPNSQEVETYISDKSFLDVIRYQAAILGKSIGVKSGEGFQLQRYLGVNDLTQLI
jgi:bacillithiol biosynthesis deacetylase BshB1